MDNNIILLNVKTADIDELAPWNSKRISSFTCSGFPIMFRGKPHIITNAHCVENAIDIKAVIKDYSEKFELELGIFALECDLALLTCKNKKLWEKLNVLELGDVPEIGTEVHVYGYALGDSAVSYTQGHINRYVLSYYNNLVSGITMQLDAVVNPGNSGGPVLDKNNKLIGVIFSGIVDHVVSGIEFAVPVFVIKFLEKHPEMIQNKRLIGLNGYNIPLQNANNSRIREFLKLKLNDHGAFSAGEIDILQSVENKKTKVNVNENGDVLLSDILKFCELENKNDPEPRVYFPLDYIFPFAKSEKIKLNFLKKSKYITPYFYPSPIYKNYLWYVVVGMVFIENTFYVQQELDLPGGIDNSDSVALVEIIPNHITDSILEAPLVLDYIIVNNKKYMVTSIQDIHSILNRKANWYLFSFHNGYVVPVKSDDIKYSAPLAKKFGINPHYKF